MVSRKKQPELTVEEKLLQALLPEAEQPYKVPDNWCWTRLEFVTKGFQYGYTEKASLEKVGPKYIRISDINNGNVDYINAPYCKIIDEDFLKYELSRGDILIARMGSVGINGMFLDDVKAVFASYLIRIIPMINNKYLSNFLQTDFYWNQIEDNAQGTTRLNVNANILKKLKIPCPPLVEQQRIVERIETLFAKLDEAKEKLQNTLDTFETRKASILHKAFTGKLTANWRKQHGLTMDSWEEKTLNDIASYKKGPFGSSITKAMFVPKTANTYKVYEQGNVIRKDLTYGHYYITSEKYQELKGFAVKAGDILISCAGTIGEVYKLPPECEEGVINQALMRVRLNQNIIEGYFCYYFGEIIKDDVIDKSNGTAMKNIPPFKVLKAIQIKLPTINEQTEIVRIVDNLLAKEQQAHSIAQNALAKIDLIKKSILARAFRGQLATNNPADEPAIELLKRVL